MPKAAAAPAPTQKKTETPSSRGGAGVPRRQDIPRMDSLSGLQHALGNQHILRLLNTHRLQLKSRGASSDPLELEADRAAELVTHRTQPPQIQRKCAGGDNCHCAKCSEDEERRRFQLSFAPNRVQRQAKDNSSANEAESPDVARGRASLGGFLVEDNATALGKGQMKKSVFLAQVTGVVCSTANAELAASGRSADDCPYISKWLAHYRNQSAAHIERALWRYAPEAAHAGSARGYLSVIRRRVRQAVATWAKTGKITGVPPGVPMTPEQGAAGVGTRGEETKRGGAEPREKEGFGTRLLRTLTGENRVQFKEQPGGSPDHADPEAIRSQLGSGKGLDSRARSRMETAFGHDFSRVRVHTDSRAEGLSSRLNARAFTIGTDIAFAPGEFRPGTLVGDALLAHELAHVVQQGAVRQAHASMTKGGSSYDSLESDADASAVGAVAGLWTRAEGKLANIGRSAAPQLKSGLKLQRCEVAAVPLVEVAAGSTEVAVVGTEAGGVAAAGTLATGTGTFTTVAPEVVGATAPEIAGAAAPELIGGATSATAPTVAATTTTTTATSTTSTLARVGQVLGLAAVTQLQDEPRQRPRKEKCTEAEKARLYDEVKQSCKRVRSCSMDTDTCDSATEKVSALYACISAREHYQSKCFSPGDPGYEGHMRQIAQLYVSLRTCDSVMRAKCR